MTYKGVRTDNLISIGGVVKVEIESGSQWHEKCLFMRGCATYRGRKSKDLMFDKMCYPTSCDSIKAAYLGRFSEFCEDRSFEKQ